MGLKGSQGAVRVPSVFTCTSTHARPGNVICTEPSRGQEVPATAPRRALSPRENLRVSQQQSDKGQGAIGAPAPLFTPTTVVHLFTYWLRDLSQRPGGGGSAGPPEGRLGLQGVRGPELPGPRTCPWAFPRSLAFRSNREGQTPGHVSSHLPVDGSKKS